MNKSFTARYEILTQAAEDWIGFWEAWWRLHTVFPERSVEEVRQAAMDIVREFVEKGLIYVCYFDEDTSREEPIASDRLTTILGDESSWEPPDGSGALQLRFATTPEGEAAWRAGTV